MENTEAIWQQRLAKRREGMPWKSIIEAEGFKYGGTFTGHLKIARERGWVPPEETLPPAIRSDGRRQGVFVPKQETPMTEVLPGQVSRETSVSAVADITPASDLSAPLSPAEVQTLEHYEQIIAQGIKTFVQVGQALLTIRDHRLYRGSYATFEDYCRQRWDLSRPYAYQLMEASVVVENVSAVADIVPANEAQARPLTSLPPEQQQQAWQEAVKTAPPTGITAKHVQATVKQLSGQKATPHIGKGQAEETRERLSERGQPNHSWINVLSHCNRLCSSLRRLPDLDEVLESWGPEGRQKAVSYLRPLYENVQDLLWSLKAIDVEPFVQPDPSEDTPGR